MLRYSRRHEDELIALYVEDECSLTEIEEATGVKANTVYKMLVRRGVPRRRRGHPVNPPISDADLSRTVWLHQQDLTYDQIGRLLGLSEGGVKHRITVARKRYGYRGTTRGANNRPKPQLPVHVARVVEAWA